MLIKYETNVSMAVMYTSYYSLQKIFFLIGFTAITTSLFINKLQVMHTSIIFSTGMNEAGPNGLNISDQISTGFMKKSVLHCVLETILYMPFLSQHS